MRPFSCVARRTRSILALCFTLLVLTTSGPVRTEEASTDVIRIEEDWELQIGIPDPNSNGPQVQNTLSVREDLDGEYAVFEVNHATQPSYRRGGMQLQSWRYNSLANYRDFEAGTMLDHEDELIRYTLSMQLENGHLRFSVNHGESETWGTFGKSGGSDESSDHTLSFDSNLPSLNGYRTETSLANSGINYASHRVKYLAIREVRYYSSSGLVRRETEERIVHSSLSNQ